MDISVIIMAAGIGSRMKSQTPKVLHKLCGKEMLFYVINEAKKISNDICVVLYHEAEKIKEMINKSFEDINIFIQDHLNFPGTGGAVMAAKPRYKKVLVLNGDMPLILAPELERFKEFEADIVMGVMKLTDPNGYGRVEIKDGEVKRIIEQKDANNEEKKIDSVNSGVYLFKKEVLNQFLPKLTNNNAQKEYYLTDIIALASKENKKIIPVFVDSTYFKGVNTKYELAEAEEIMCERIRQNWLLKGVIMRLPKTIYIEYDVKLEGECIIENGVSLIGNCKIQNSIIKSNSIIEDSTIINSDIGPLAHLRPGCEVIDSHIGNFVELKKAKLNGVKAGHLSYLGDCEIDNGTNIGAGTITCNYDGKNKHKTIIGKNVFVGSDTQFVAPVVIEDNVIIAAGTTITKDVKNGSLAISRTPQTNKEGFYFKYFKK